MPSARVNGLNIWTEKRGISTINNLVVFGDGSIYNTTTGVFRNEGPGDVFVNGVKLGSSSTPQDTPPAEGPSLKNFGSFNAHRLDLSVSTVNAEVVVWDGDGIEVQAEGLPSLTDAIEVSCIAGIVTVDERPSSLGSGLSFSGISVMGDVFVSGNGGVMMSSFGSGSTMIMGSNLAKVTIKVPAGTAILAQITGNSDINIGNVNGQLITLIKGNGDITAGDMTDLDLVTMGNGKTYVSKASGTVRVDARGNGGTTIDGGEVSKLTVYSQSNGSVKARVTAAEADLTVKSNGDISVDRVLKEPVKLKRGTGRIKVRQVG